MSEVQLHTGSHGLELGNLDEMWRFANMVSKSGLAPKALSQPTQILVALQHGLEVGLKPLQALNSIAVINGKPSIYGDAGTALVQASGLLEDREELYEGQGDDLMAICRLRRKGSKYAVVGTFSIADAKLAGLLSKGGPWKSYPRRMLMWRARTFAYRDGFADVLCGLTFAEEAMDIEPTATEHRVKPAAQEVDLDAILDGTPKEEEQPELVVEAAEPEPEPEEEPWASPEPASETASVLFDDNEAPTPRED